MAIIAIIVSPGLNNVLRTSLNSHQLFSSRAMNDTYRFGPFVLDPTRRAVTRDGVDVSVTPKAFDILWYLVQHPNRVVSKQELMKAVWPDTIVEEGNLTQN